MAFKAMVSWLAFLLGHEDYEVRERTTRMLAACDQWVVLTPFLEALEKEDDLEVQKRSRRARFTGSRVHNWRSLAGLGPDNSINEEDRSPLANLPNSRPKPVVTGKETNGTPKRGVPTP